MITSYIQVEKKYLNIVKYSWELFCKHFNIKYAYAEKHFDISIGFNSNNSIHLSKDFFNKIKSQDFAINSHFKNEPVIYNSNNKKDYLSTIFYLVNSLQEYNSTNLDNIGRFSFKDSLQKKYNCINSDLVSQYFYQLKQDVPVLKKESSKRKKSRFFISHDNDTFYASFLQDGFWALKNKRFDIVLKLIFLELMRKPTWFNLDKIMDINDEHGIKSTFFWLVNKGNTGIIKNIQNSDYNFKSARIQKQLRRIKKRGFYNGLHKSISKESFSNEINKLPFYPTSNRNHYLRFSIPKHYNELDKTKIKIDFSLGFAEHFGFRNSYGLPFKPFNLNTNSTHKVLEVPLAIMDTTFHTYLKTDINKTKNLIIDFLDRNINGQLLSILWHNKFFTPYKFNGYLNIYKTILTYFKDADIEPINEEEILKLYT